MGLKVLPSPPFMYFVLLNLKVAVTFISPMFHPYSKITLNAPLPIRTPMLSNVEPKSPWKSDPGEGWSPLGVIANKLHEAPPTVSTLTGQEKPLLHTPCRKMHYAILIPLHESYHLSQWKIEEEKNLIGRGGSTGFIMPTMRGSPVWGYSLLVR